MLSLDYILFCDKKEMKGINEMNLFNVFDGLYSTGFPVKKEGILVFRVRASGSDYKKKANIEVKIFLDDLEGNSFIAESVNIDINKDNTHVFDVPMGSFTFGRQGMYTVDVLIDGSLVGSTKLKVMSLDELTE